MTDPPNLIRDVLLRDGTSLRLRQATPADTDTLLRFLQGLSTQSLYFRFCGFPHLGHELVARYLTGDGPGRVSLLATAGGEIVAIGTLDRLRDAASAEVAFAVADRLQGQGVGTRLLEQLADIAVGRDIEQFVADVDAENAQMLAVFRDAGFEVTRHLEAGTLEVQLRIAPTERYHQAVDRRDHTAAVASLHPFFAPTSVAVAGASPRRDRVGHAVFGNLIAGGFAGAAYPINRSGDSVAGRPGYRTFGELPSPADLAVICVPAEAVLEQAAAALDAGTRAICVISAGFAEVGPEGVQREADLLALVRDRGARLLGPNCLGIAVPGWHLNATFASRPLLPGSIGCSSQSGALGLAVLEHAASRGFGLSSFVSVGNKADISTNDLLEYWEEDDATRLVLLYMESFGNPRRFARIAERVARRKPILAMKGGTSSAGARAAQSHTAALAGSDAAASALYAQAGVLRIRTLEELLDTASFLVDSPLPAGNRVAVVTNAGGLGILCADACSANGLELASFGEETTEHLRACLPAHASSENPVDLLGSAPAELYEKALSLVLADPGVDAAITLFAPASMATADDVAAAICAGARAQTKPVAAVIVSADGIPAQLVQPGSPARGFAYPESAVQTLARAVERTTWLRRPVGVEHRPEGIDRLTARQIVADELRAGSDWLAAPQLRALLGCYGLPSVPEVSASDPGEAVAAAEELGYPVALKLAAPGLHKTEVGGVALDLRDQSAVREAAQRLGAAVLVQPMITGGVELLLGALQDPVFGAVIAFGAGGTLAELVGGAGVRLAPITDVDAEELVSAGTVGRLLRGFRGAAPANTAAVIDALHRLSALAEDTPELAELDLNPMIAGSDGCVIVDARARLTTAPTRPGAKTW